MIHSSATSVDARDRASREIRVTLTVGDPDLSRGEIVHQGVDLAKQSKANRLSVSWA